MLCNTRVRLVWRNAALRGGSWAIYIHSSHRANFYSSTYEYLMFSLASFNKFFESSSFAKISPDNLRSCCLLSLTFSQQTTTFKNVRSFIGEPSKITEFFRTFRLHFLFLVMNKSNIKQMMSLRCYTTNFW